MEKYLQNKVALVTGGFSGIGLAICKSLAHHGAAVAVGGRTINQESIVQIQSIGSPVFYQSLDVRDTTNINVFITKSEQALGPIDILVNAAGISTQQPVCNHGDDIWDDIIATNLSGPFKMTRACLEGMKNRKWGRIINIGSTAARTAKADSPAYCASKSGLLGLTRAVALEGAMHGISCVMISPTWVETEMMQKSMQCNADKNNTSIEDEIAAVATQTPQKRLVQPGEIGSLAAFLCRDEALGITMEDIQLNAGALW